VVPAKCTLHGTKIEATSRGRNLFVVNRDHGNVYPTPQLCSDGAAAWRTTLELNLETV